MGRPKQFDEDEVLAAAMELFWRQGYKATSVRDLVKQTGIGEGSLYDSFGGKRELFLAALERYRTQFAPLLKRLERPGSPKRAIEDLVYLVAGFLAAQEDHRGCMVTNTTIELAAHDPQMREILRKTYSTVEGAFYKVLRRARDAGELPEDANLRSLARFLTQSLEGMRVLAKTGLPRRTLRDMARVTLSVLSTGNSSDRRTASLKRRRRKIRRTTRPQGAKS